MNYVDSGNPVVVYSYFGNAFYGSPHAIVLLDARNTSGTNEVFVVNPYFTISFVPVPVLKHSLCVPCVGFT